MRSKFNLGGRTTPNVDLIDALFKLLSSVLINEMFSSVGTHEDAAVARFSILFLCKSSNDRRTIGSKNAGLSLL